MTQACLQNKIGEPDMKLEESDDSNTNFEYDPKTFEPVTQITEENIPNVLLKLRQKEIEGYECPVCQKEFPSRSKIEEHFVSEHEGIKPYHCSICDASFSRHRNLKGHISKVHEQNRAHAVHERDIFEPVKQIIEQNRTEESKTGFKEIDAFQCPICQLKFPSRTKIEEHFILEHEGIKPYHCSICDARFSKQKGLKEHIRYVHEQNSSKQRALAVHERDIFEPVTQITEDNLPDSDSSSKVLIKEIDAFQCPVCKSKFPSRIKIEEHFVSQHEGMKPYHCAICNARFSYQRTLTAHIRSVHEQNRAHLCDLCGKSFNYNHDLKRHTLAVHERNDPRKDLKGHQCSTCGACFGYDRCLKRSGIFLSLSAKVSFFHQCSKMQIIPIKKFNIQTCFFQFLWFFRLKC